MNIEPIAHIRTDFPEKFGIPRQSNVVEDLEGQIVFTGPYRNPDYLRGIEGYSHLWLIWGFSANIGAPVSPTVRPPRLGGNVRMGVFATRSPFRPNPLALSCVRLEKVEWGSPEGPVLHVRGADMMDGSPIYDIKPYLAESECYPDAKGGFTKTNPWKCLGVEWDCEPPSSLTDEKKQTITRILEQDPRPSYQADPDRVYGMTYAGYEIHFQVKERTLHVLSVCNKTPEKTSAPDA